METQTSEWVKISARMPREVIESLSHLYPHESFSELLRNLMEREVSRRKVLKAHLKLYGRFKPEHFDASLF